MLQKSPSDMTKELLLLPTPFPDTHLPPAPISWCVTDTTSCPGLLVYHQLSRGSFYNSKAQKIK